MYAFTFVKLAERHLICGVQTNDTVGEFFEGWFRACEGNPSLMQHADTQDLALSSMSANGRARLKQLLSDPDPGNPWKFDDPVWVPGENPPIPSNYWARGVMLELDIYKRVYKPGGFAHHPNAAGYDFSGTKWVQIKSLSNPNAAVQRMESAIEQLRTSDISGVAPLKLHVLMKPGANGDALQAALDLYKAADDDLAQRLEVLIEHYNLGSQ